MIFEYKGEKYPSYIKRGNAVKFVLMAAKEFCNGIGLDIGGTPDWSLPGAEIINPIYTKYDAMKFPYQGVDYIFSSHCLEHIQRWKSALKYWTEAIRHDGILYLYLPHPDMEYWHPENCKKHIHLFSPDEIKKELEKLGYRDIIMSGRDMYWSFSIVGRKS